MSEPAAPAEHLAARAAEVAALLASAREPVVLTGAGVSTESGIPDFRSARGLWTAGGLEELAHVDTFHREPTLTWGFYRDRLDGMREVRPNPGHYALAELERLGAVRGIVTQNVDGLHAAAGSRLVLEMHGSLRVAVCPGCRDETDMASALERFDAQRGLLPRCGSCPGQPVLKPGVVLFGESMPPALDAAWALIEGCDLLLVCGSSLTVFPVASMPEIVRVNGGTVVVVDTGDSVYPRADLVIEAPTGVFLPLLAARVRAARGG